MAGTDKSQQITFHPAPAVILCEPQLGENIGTTARAMANFGLWDLRLVNPRDGWPNEKAIAAASRADHVIERVRVFETTEEAIADLSLVFATTARRRDLQKPVFGPEEAAQRVIAHIGPAVAPGCCSAASAGASTMKKWRSATPSSPCRSRPPSPRSISPRPC